MDRAAHAAPLQDLPRVVGQLGHSVPATQTWDLRLLLVLEQPRHSSRHRRRVVRRNEPSGDVVHDRGYASGNQRQTDMLSPAIAT